MLTFRAFALCHSESTGLCLEETRASKLMYLPPSPWPTLIIQHLDHRSTRTRKLVKVIFNTFSCSKLTTIHGTAIFGWENLCVVATAKTGCTTHLEHETVKRLNNCTITPPGTYRQVQSKQQQQPYNIEDKDSRRHLVAKKPGKTALELQRLWVQIPFKPGFFQFFSQQSACVDNCENLFFYLLSSAVQICFKQLYDKNRLISMGLTRK